jgi:hypothetical protein
MAKPAAVAAPSTSSSSASESEEEDTGDAAESSSESVCTITKQHFFLESPLLPLSTAASNFSSFL